MTRIKGTGVAQKHRKKMKGFEFHFRGAHAKLTRSISQQTERALLSSHRDREKQKRNFRRLWIIRINALIRERGVLYTYSKYIHELYKSQLLLNRKILSQIGISNRNSLYMISNEI
nr:ribosomal protein L20 [Utricularia graminifolia]